jgi:hypothetical protein
MESSCIESIQASGMILSDILAILRCNSQSKFIKLVICAGKEGRQLAEGVTAAEEAAGEPLFDRVLEIMHALLSGQWASWLRGSKVSHRST